MHRLDSFYLCQDEKSIDFYFPARQDARKNESLFVTGLKSVSGEHAHVAFLTVHMI